MSSSAPNKATKPLRIGVLYEQVQMTDLAGLDILGNMSTRVYDMIKEVIPSLKALESYAVPMEFLYISSSLELAWATPEMYIRPSHTYDDAPRNLDIIMLGGPDPYNVPEASLKFLDEASKQCKAILTTCTGGMWLAKSGVLDGKKATTNRILLEAAKSAFPKVNWMDQRWVIDEGHFEGAELWTAGGAGCGIDMVIEYALKNFHEKMVAQACQSLDFEMEGRAQLYKGPLRSVV